MGVLRFPKWQKPCEDALLEADEKRLFRRVIVAERAISHRLHDLATTPEKIELIAIDNMLASLRCLVANALNLPDDEEQVTNKLLQMPNNRLKPSEPRGKLISIA
jgi:hypothetical protein